MTLLEQVGRALYGERWQSALAQDLGVADRTMRRWAAGAEPPESVWAELRQLCQVRQIKLQRLQAKLP